MFRLPTFLFFTFSFHFAFANLVLTTTSTEFYDSGDEPVPTTVGYFCEGGFELHCLFYDKDGDLDSNVGEISEQEGPLKPKDWNDFIKKTRKACLKKVSDKKNVGKAAFGEVRIACSDSLDGFVSGGEEIFYQEKLFP